MAKSIRIRILAVSAALLLLGACQPKQPPPPGSIDPSIGPSEPAVPPEPTVPAGPDRVPPRGPSDFQPQVPDASARIQTAKANNPETVGWLYIPDTAVDEPVFQTYDNTYYLFYDGLGNPRKSGSLFVDYESSLGDGNGESFSQNTIIYGHNLGNPMGIADDPNAERFAQLLKFTDEEFAQKHPYIYFSTGAGVQVYEIFSVGYVDSYAEPVTYIHADYPPLAFSLLVDDMRARSLFNYDVPVEADDRIITLSCCTHKYGTENENPYQRFVVMGRLVPENWPLYETAGFTPNSSIKEPDFSKYDTAIPLEDRLAKIDWLDMTAAQRIADFDFLFKTLQKNYPYWGLMERKSEEKIDWGAEYTKLRAQVEQCVSDADFVGFIQTMMLYGTYLEDDVWGFPELGETYERAAQSSPDDKLLHELARIYSATLVKEGYAKMVEPHGLILSYSSAYSDAKAKEEKGTASRYVYSGRARPSPVTLPAVDGDGKPLEILGTQNVKAAVLQEGKIAYVRINAFDEKHIEADKAFLLDFYRRIQNYGHIIFDVTESFGTFTRYFDELLAAPNIDATLSVPHYEFAKDGANNYRFLGGPSDGWMPIPDDLPGLSRLIKSDLSGLDIMRKVERRIEPGQGGKTLGGKIWMLTGDWGGYASQHAASMAKATGFATLVGGQAAGGGFGVEPLAVALPNSGLVVRYRADYAATGEGVSLPEAGAVPDIPSPEGESPLDTCLRAINPPATE